MLTVQVHIFVGTLSLNSASVKNWPSSAWVGITDPKAWAVQLAWPLGRSGMRSSTFWKGNNSWSRETENKGKTLNLWPGGLVGGLSPLSAVLSALRSTPHSLTPPQSSEGFRCGVRMGTDVLCQRSSRVPTMLYPRVHVVKGFFPSPRKFEHNPPNSF